MSPEQKTQAIIIDAATQFALRSQAAQFEIGKNEIAIISDTVAMQPDAFESYISGLSTEAADMLEGDFRLGFRGGLSASLPEQKEYRQRGIDDDASVFYTREVDSEPRLEVRIGVIDYLNRAIEPAFNVLNETKNIENQREAGENAEQQLRVATAMATWMALGKWAFDTLDPRDEGWQENSKLQTDLLDRLRCNTVDQSFDTIEKVNRVMIIARYKFMGSTMYAGAASELSKGTIGFNTNLDYLRIISLALFADKSRVDPTSVTGVQYALAQPLSERHAAHLMNVLATSE